LNNDFRLPNQPEFPLVSVCIPAYNAEKTLRETLESLSEQDYPNYDIVVADNRSTDGTKEIVLDYAKQGIRYCVSPEKPAWVADLPDYIGAYVNANFALSQGGGEFLCLRHADDLFDPTMISRQVDLMQTVPRVGAVFTMLCNIGDDGQPLRIGCTRLPRELRGRQQFVFGELYNAVLAHGNFIATPSLMIRRAVFNSVGGFDERRFRTSADLDMWLRIAQQYAVGIIDEPLLHYRVSRRQGGARYHQLRTSLWGFFVVMDHYLTLPSVQQMVKAKALRSYQVNRSADQVLCAMNMLVLGQVEDARRCLQLALNWRDFVTACRRPRRLAWLLVGVGLLMCTRLGFGICLAKLLYWFRERNQKRRQGPAPN
jgi:hypothetical protein